MPSFPHADHALIAGATGLVGRALLRRLPAHYRHITVLARRPVPPDVAGVAGLVWRRVDFDRLPEQLESVGAVYIALGTTVRDAGSEAAFRRVDHDAVIATALAGRRSGATRLAVVSALGANVRSRVFYNRVKGGMEAAISDLGYASVAIAQPSLLVGDRRALGQPVRSGETLANRLLLPISGLVPLRWRPIDAERVADALLQANLAGRVGVQRLSSAQMQAPAPPPDNVPAPNGTKPHP